MRPEAKKWGQRKEKIKKGKPEDMKLTKKKLEILDQSSVSELFVQNRTLQEFEKLKYLYREMNCATTVKFCILIIFRRFSFLWIFCYFLFYLSFCYFFKF